MNEQTMIWFLQKTSKYALSKEAEGLWMDFYSYLQNQSRACNPQIPFSVLQQVCDLKEEELQMACQELKDADMCDVVGVSGIIRTFQYSIKHNKPFFDKNIFPSNDLESLQKSKQKWQYRSKMRRYCL